MKMDAKTFAPSCSYDKGHFHVYSVFDVGGVKCILVCLCKNNKKFVLRYDFAMHFVAELHQGYLL